MTKKLLIFFVLIGTSFFLKAQCGPSYGDNANFDSAGSSIGISFTIDNSCGGTLTSITFSAGFTVQPASPTNTTGYATVRLYEGNGLAGNVLGTLNNVELNTTDTFDFSALMITMNPASQYTIILSDFTLPVNTGRGFNTPWFPNYTGGSLYMNDIERPGEHLAFSVNIDNSTLSVHDAEITHENVQIYPNPTADFVKLIGISKEVTYTIFDISGKSVITGIARANEEIKLQKLTKGIYFIRLKKKVLKLIKN